MKGFGDIYKDKKKINKKTKVSKEQIINQAFTFHSEGNIPDASKYYQYFINQGFEDHRVFSNYGSILQNIGKLQDAEISLRKAIELNPNYANAHCNLGNVLKDLDKLQDAEKSYRKAIELNPNFANAHYNLGNVLKDLDKLEDAEKSYRKAIELNPNFAEAYSNLGNVLKDLGKSQDAELSTRKAIELNPNYSIAHYNLGIILKDLGKLQDAEKSYRKTIELNPNFADVHYNLGIILKDLGKLEDAELSTRKAIELNPHFANAHFNLGSILIDLGKLEDAELSTRKAIEINPNYAEAHYNLGNVLKDLGKLQDAEKSYHKTIELNPNFAEAYYSLSLIQYSDDNKLWQDQIFSKNILMNKSKKDQVNIYFARANILHKRKKYKDSSLYLELANNLKLDIYPSNSDHLLKKSKKLFIESDKKEIQIKEDKIFSENIFIVGMPRCGSTLVESILSMRDDLYDLGETIFLGELFVEWKNSKQNVNLAELYKKKLKTKTKFQITTNKNLYNYQYSGIIANQIPNAKIIHCFRNPLDNILSIYRAHFAIGNEYTSSLVDCAKVYLDQENIMSEYKNRFRAKIYNLNYDSLVLNPNQEIKSLLSWLGWKWNDSYLSPHLNPRPVLTASSVQVRSPINSKSINGWKNYKEMLKPAIEIITQIDKYRDLIL